MTTPVRTEAGWYVDLRLDGRGSRRLRKTFKTKSEAKAFISFAMAKRHDDKAWVAQRDRRRLTELVDIWYNSHGCTLRDGERRRDWLLRLAHLAGNPLGESFTAASYNKLRQLRLTKVTANTCNRDLAYMRALFNTLINLKQISYANPLERVPQVLFKPTAVTDLTDSQISDLLAYLVTVSPDAHAITTLCLSAGFRWSEAENLTCSDVLDAGQIRVFGKNGKFRFLPISPEALGFVRGFCHGKKKHERIFASSYNIFRRAIDHLEIHLPRGQLTHVLRHTFATQFLRRGGDIPTLQRVLDHVDVRMTMRYAHAESDYLSAVLAFNPLAKNPVLNPNKDE